MKAKSIFPLMLLLVLLAACGEQPEHDERARASRAARAKGDILIGVPGPWNWLQTDRSLYWEGLQMALEEVNDGGGVLGRRLRFIKEDDEGTVSKGRIVAQSFADNPDVVAVIGHFSSIVSLPASLIYEHYGVLMLSPTSTSPELTSRRGLKYVFRNIPTDEEVAEQLAEYLKRKGYDRVVTYYLNDDYGRGLVNAFEIHASEIGCTIVDRLSYDSIARPKYFKRSLESWKKNFTFDAIFLAGVVPQAAEFIVKARQLGITALVVGGDGLNSPRLLEVGGDWVEGTIAASYHNEKDSSPLVQDFNKAFMKRYGEPPDDWAVQGYDAVKLLAHAMQEAGTTVPIKVADALRTTRGWMGITGVHTFDAQGDVVGKPIVLRVVRNGKFQILGD